MESELDINSFIVCVLQWLYDSILHCSVFCKTSVLSSWSVMPLIMTLMPLFFFILAMISFSNVLRKGSGPDKIAKLSMCCGMSRASPEG